MSKHLKILTPLALILLIAAPVTLWVEHALFDVNLTTFAQQLMVVSILFFAYSILEMIVVGRMIKKDVSFALRVGLGFSLFRLLMTIGLLFYYKWAIADNFGIAFVNILIFYTITLAYSTWVKRKEHHNHNQL